MPLLVPRCALTGWMPRRPRSARVRGGARARARPHAAALQFSGKPIITPLIYERCSVMPRQRRGAAMDGPGAGAVGRAREPGLLYVPSNGYVAAFWSALRQVDPHGLRRGLPHVPCWTTAARATGARSSGWPRPITSASDAPLAATRGRQAAPARLAHPAVGSPAQVQKRYRTGRLPRLPTRHRRAWERALPGHWRTFKSVRSPPGRPVTSLPAVGLPHASPTRLVEHRPVCAVRRPEVSGVERRGGGGPPARQP